MFNLKTYLMKRLTLMLAAMLVVSVFSFAQEEYTMYRVVYMQPDYENLEELGEAVKEHNKKYFNEAPSTGHIWMVQTGPHTGQWLYVVGPTTFTDMDGIELGEDHRDHWIGEVMPNVESVSDGGFWRMNDELTYQPSDMFTGKEVLTFFKIKDFEEYRFKALVKKVKEVYEAKEYPGFFQFYSSQFSRKCGYDMMIASGFENWAHFDNRPNFRADYEEIHGEWAFFEFMEEFREVVEGDYDEIIMYAPELSADPAE
jgi:hypothetical protein